MRATDGDCNPPVGTSLDCVVNPDLYNRQLEVALCTKKANGTVLKVTSIPNFTKHYVNGRQGVTKVQSVGPCCDKTTLLIPTSGEVFNKACKGPATSTEAVLSYINNEENCKSCDDPSKC